MIHSRKYSIKMGEASDGAQGIYGHTYCLVQVNSPSTFILRCLSTKVNAKIHEGTSFWTNQTQWDSDTPGADHMNSGFDIIIDLEKSTITTEIPNKNLKLELLDERDPDMGSIDSMKRLMEHLNCQDDTKVTDGRTHRMRHRTARSVARVSMMFYF